MSMGMAVSAMTGQNLGADKPERIKDIFKWGVVMTSFTTIIISLFVVLFSREILVAFGMGKDMDVMDFGVAYLHIVGSCYVFFAIMFISNGIINGAGHTIITMVFSLLSLWIIRVPFSWFLSKNGFGITGIWVAVSLSFFVAMIISLGYYFSGKWNNSSIIKKNS
jgi:Na+-driven multidrug efflux pump